MATKKKSKKRPTRRPKPAPLVLSINICDTVIRDEKTRKVSLIGLFSVINAQTFPVRHPLMHVYVAMTNGHGQQQIGIQFVKISDGKALFGMQGDIVFPSPLQVVELNLEWRDVMFDEPGDYVVEVLCGGQKIGDRKFKVINSQVQLPPTKGTGE